MLTIKINNMKSDFLKLNLKDLLNSFLVSVLGAILTYIAEVVQSGSFTEISLKTIGVVAVGAFSLWLSKNLLTNSDGQVMKSEV